MKSVRPKPLRFGRSYFTAILAAFMLIALLIDVASFLFFSSRSRHILEREIRAGDMSIIQQFKGVMDIVHTNLVPALYNTMNNPELARVLSSADPSESDYIAALAQIDALPLIYPLLHSVYVVNTRTDNLLTTSSGLVSVAEFPDPGIWTIVNNLEEYRINRYIPRIARLEDSFSGLGAYEEPVLTLVAGRYSRGTSRLHGLLLCNIKESSIEQLFFSANKSEGKEYLVFNSTGQVISSSLDVLQFGESLENTRFQSLLNQAREQKQGSYSDQEGRLITYSYSSSLDWIIATISTTLPVQREITQLRRGFSIIASIILLVSTLVFSSVTWLLYRPIELLLSQLSEEHGEQGRMPGRRQLDRSPDTEAEFIGQDIYRSLLRGDRYVHWEEELSGDGLKFIHSDLFVYLLQIDNFAQLEHSLSEENLQQLHRAYIESLSNDLDTIVSCRIIDLNFREVCVLAPPDSPAQRLLTRFTSTISHSFGITVSIGVSHKDSSEALESGYSKADAAVLTKFKSGPGSWIQYLPTAESPRIFPRERAEKLLRSLRLGDAHSCYAILDTLLEPLREAGLREYRNHMSLLAYMLLTPFMERSLKDDFLKLQEIRESPDKLEFLEDARSFFKARIAAYVTDQDENIIHRKRSVLERVELLIHENCSDPGFCVQSLSDALEFSPNYLRQIYKQYTNSSLSDAITAARIDIMRTLLISSRKPVKELYTEAGFVNYTSFITSFKKITGLTPGEFRVENAEK